MKRTILLSIAACLFVSSAFAQKEETKFNDEVKKYRFGLFVGPTFNSLKPTSDVVKDDKGNYKVSSEGGRTSFSVGLNAEVNLNSKYSIYSGVGLDWNGGSITATWDTASTLDADYAKSSAVDYKNQYLAIPLGIKMYAAEFADIKIFAQTGVDLSLLLAQKGNYNIVKKSDSIEKDNNVKLNNYAQVTPINIGWHIGAGAEYGLPSGSAVYAAILYRNGFTDYTTPKLNTAGLRISDGNIRSNTIAVRIGYFF